MKVFKVEATHYDRGETISMTIIAESKEHALEIAEEGNLWKAYEDDPAWLDENSDEFWEYRKTKQPIEYPEGTLFWKFENRQFPLIVTEINLNKELVVDVSNWED